MAKRQTFLGRCSGSDQVHPVPSLSDGGWTIPLKPKKKKKKKNISELRRAVPLELACMEATHLACKVSAADCPDVGSGKRRGRQVKTARGQWVLGGKRPDELAFCSLLILSLNSSCSVCVRFCRANTSLPHILRVAVLQPASAA